MIGASRTHEGSSLLFLYFTGDIYYFYKWKHKKQELQSIFVHEKMLPEFNSTFYIIMSLFDVYVIKLGYQIKSSQSSHHFMRKEEKCNDFRSILIQGTSSMDYGLNF